MRIPIKRNWPKVMERQEPYSFRSSEDVSKIVLDILSTEDGVGRNQEHFYVFGLDTKNRIQLIYLVSLGAMNSCVVDPRILFRAVLMQGCAGMILAHNHPSGDPTPSAEDVNITNRIKDGCKLLSLAFVDHVVVCEKSFYSFAESFI